MKCSANEVMTLATKAARGGGAAPAQAAMFGQAVLCHLIAGRDVGHIIDAFEALPIGPIHDTPLKLMEFLECAENARVDLTLAVEGQSQLFVSYLEAQPYASEVRATPDGQSSITLFLNKPNTPRPSARIDLPAALYARMTALAAKILVPENEASRLSGAGAGLTDND